MICCLMVGISGSFLSGYQQNIDMILGDILLIAIKRYAGIFAHWINQPQS